jgi:hypothetical protein
MAAMNDNEETDYLVENSFEDVRCKTVEDLKTDLLSLSVL